MKFQLISLLSAFASSAAKSSGLQGVFIQPTQALKTAPGYHTYIAWLEFDPDVTYYLQTGAICNTKFCPMIALVPQQGAYTVSYNSLQLNSTLGGSTTYSFQQAGSVLTLNQAVLNKQATFCQSGYSNQCISSQNAVCAKDSQCRLSGRYLTPCPNGNECDSALNYLCSSGFCMPPSSY